MNIFFWQFIILFLQTVLFIKSIQLKNKKTKMKNFQKIQHHIRYSFIQQSLPVIDSHNSQTILEESYQNLILKLKENYQKLTCSEKNQSIQFCCSKNCLNNAFICGERDCQCKDNHQSCFNYFQEKSFLKSIERKLSKQKKAFEEIENKFENLINQISLFKEKILKSIKYMLFEQDQIKFIVNVLAGQQQKCRGKSLNKCFENLQNLKVTQSKQNKTKNDLIKNLQEFCENTLEIIDDCQSFKLQSFFQNKNPFITSRRESNDISFKSICDSKIIQIKEQFQNLRDFLPQRKIKKLKLLYRASEENFKVNSFYEKCSNIPHTIILIKTSKHKIIGGYTPLAWKKYLLKQMQIQDTSKQTFLFSLTNKEKFQLTDQRYAIYYVQGSGPRFGKIKSADLGLSDEANTLSNNNYCFRQYLYKNPKYQRNKQLFRQFTGFQDQIFSTLEWEVFEVIF